MTASAARRQRGAALLAMLAVTMLAASWFLVSQLNAQSGAVAAVNRARNAAVLNRAKVALIGYLAMKAAESGERNPGRLPCPEGVSYIGVPASEGIAWNGFGTDCASVGRLPWRTLGLEKPIDSTGEPLWYVVGPEWRLTTSTSTLVINSNTAGDTTVDGQQVVALIIAPGAAMNVQSATGCTARNQARTTPSSTIDPADYIECYSGLQFVTTAASTSYNDQLVRITVADIMPAIEAAIVNRIEREIAPLFTGIYSAQAAWNTSPDKVLLPMALTFSSPTANVNAYAGTPAGQGLLPLSHAETAAGTEIPCTPVATAPNHCEPNFVRWSGTPTLTLTSVISTQLSSCSVNTVTYSASPLVQYSKIDCTAMATNWAGSPDATFELVGSAVNAGATLRQLRTAATMSGISAASRTASATLDSSGTAAVTLGATATGTTQSDATCGLSGFAALFLNCYTYSLSVPIFLLADHANVHTLLDSTNATTGWFVRNKWHELSYYAVAAAVAPGGIGTCDTSSTCLNVTYHPNDGKQRAVLVLAGRTLTGQDRSSSVLSNWFEGANADGLSPFEKRSATAPFNDRIAVVSTNP